MPGRREALRGHFVLGLLAGSIGGACIALAGHLALLKAYGTPLPYRDQWRCTAIDVLKPWVEGHLGWRNFFEPLNDHWPVLTRALSFLLLQLNGQWNNVLEASVNALILATALAVFLVRILPGLRGWTRAPFALLTGVVFALPITWENTLWGIQSLVYLQILLSLIYLASLCTARSFSWWWWTGQITGAILLLTQHSAILAQAAGIVLLGWRWWRQDGDRRVILASLACAAGAIALFALFFPSLSDTAALRAESAAVGLDVFLRQLAWPLPHPAWAFFVYLPWLVWALDRWFSRRIDRWDAWLLVVGLWIGAQGAAIAYGRGAATDTFVSRYCDFLALGFLVNAACLVRLSLTFRSRRFQIGFALFALGWLITPLKSFHWEATESHAGYNLQRRRAENARNMAAVQTYVATHDASLISDDNGRGLYSYPPAIPPLLDDPRFRAFLPPEIHAPEARTDHGRLARLPNLLLRNPAAIGAAGILLVGLCGLIFRPRTSNAEPPTVRPGNWSPRGVSLLFASLAVGSAAALACWDAPLLFDREQRLHRIFVPGDPGVSVTPLLFRRGDVASHPEVAAEGAVETTPADTRPFARGTRLAGEGDFTGILLSQPLSIHRRTLSIPFTGYPCSTGNGLRWGLFDPVTRKETWLSYVGPNPGTNWAVWSVDVTNFRGQEARVYLFDGRGDEEGWVGVANAAQTDNASFGDRWLHRLRSERTDGAHVAIAGLSFFCFLALGTMFARERLVGRKRTA